MQAVTTERIQQIYWPVIVSTISHHLPKLAQKAKQQGALCMLDELNIIVFEFWIKCIYGFLPDNLEAMRVSTDEFLWSFGSPVYAPQWWKGRKAVVLHLGKLNEALRGMPRENREPRSLLEALALDDSEHRLSDEAIVNECFHSTFVGYGGFVCFTVNMLMQLCLNPPEMRLAVEEALTAQGRCCSSFPFLQDCCPYTTMAVHETKRIHKCSNEFLFGRARCDFAVGGVNVCKGEQVLGALALTNTDPKVWGEDATTWRPSRMEKIGGASTHENGDLSGPWQGPFKHAFCPHGAGDRFGPNSRRRCPAEELTTLVVKLLVVEILSQYKLELTQDQDLTPADIALPVPTDGLRAILTPRSV